MYGPQRTDSQRRSSAERICNIEWQRKLHIQSGLTYISLDILHALIVVHNCLMDKWSPSVVKIEILNLLHSLLYQETGTRCLECRLTNQPVCHMTIMHLRTLCTLRDYPGPTTELKAPLRRVVEQAKRSKLLVIIIVQCYQIKIQGEDYYTLVFVFLYRVMCRCRIYKMLY